MRIVVKMLIVLLLVSQISYALEIANFYDKDNNKWTMSTGDAFEISLDKLIHPNINNIKFTKNGYEAFADSEIQKLALEYIVRSAEIDIYSKIVGDSPNEIFLSDLKYWTTDCSAALSIYCGLAKIDFDYTERRNIYEELIYNAVSSVNVPQLMGTEYIKLSNGTHLLGSPINGKLLDDLIKVGEVGGIGSTGSDLLEGVIKFFSEKPDIEIPNSIGNVAEIASIMSAVGDAASIINDVSKYMLLREYLINSELVDQRIETFKEIINIAKELNIADDALIEAFYNVEFKIKQNKETFRSILVNRLSTVAVDGIATLVLDNLQDDKIILMMLKKTEKMLNSSSNLSSTKAITISSNLAVGLSAVLNAKDLFSMGNEKTDNWRKVFLSYSLNQLLGRYSFHYDPIKVSFDQDSNNYVYYNSLKETRYKAFHDIVASIAKSYYDSTLVLVDSNWANFGTEFVNGTLSSLASPQMYALNYSAAAFSLGSQLGAELSSLVSNNEINDAKNSLSDLMVRMTNREIALSRWSNILIEYSQNYTDLVVDDNVSVTASVSLSKYEAYIGDSISAASNVSYNGSGNLSYSWKLFKPDGSTQIISTSSTASFNVQNYGSYGVILSVTDGEITQNSIMKSVLVKDQSQSFYDPEAFVIIDVTVEPDRCGDVIQLDSYTLKNGEYWDEPKMWATTYADGYDDHIYLMASVNERPSVDSAEADSYCSQFGLVGDRPFNYDFMMDTHYGDDNSRGAYTEVKEWSRVLKPGDTVYFAVGVSTDYSFDIEQMIMQTNILIDNDGDGISDEKDAFDNDSAASDDSDGDGYPDAWITGKTESSSTTGLKLDKFPLDPAAYLDSDNDGYPDSWIPGKSQAHSTTGLIIDKFPQDASEYADKDQDGVGDNTDKFPDEPDAWKDSDGDNYPDFFVSGKTEGIDKFPTDPAAAIDSDDDGYPDYWNQGMDEEDSITLLELDKFPYDSAAYKDEDYDGAPDNWVAGFTGSISNTGLKLDAFLNNHYEWLDSDSDGVGDNADVAPNDPKRYSNKAPTIISVDESIVYAGENTHLLINYTDCEDDDVEMTVSSTLPAKVINETHSQYLSVNPESNQVGTHDITIIARDEYGGYATFEYSISVEPPRGKIEASHEEVIFEDTVVGLDNQEIITINNVGLGDLEIESIELLTGVEYKIDTENSTCAGEIVLTGGDSCSLYLDFIPDTIGEFTDLLTFNSSDLSNNQLEVSISGVGINETSGDGIEDIYESDADTDLNGVFDKSDPDNDGDGISDVDEGMGDADNDGILDMNETDSDDDGLLDSIEVSVGLNPYLASDAFEDLDNDGYSNFEEILAGTNHNDSSSLPVTKEVSSIYIKGYNNIPESSNEQYKAYAVYSDNSYSDITNDVTWSFVGTVDEHIIDNTGYLSAGQVSQDEDYQISAEYVYDSIEFISTKDIKISDSTDIKFTPPFTLFGSISEAGILMNDNCSIVVKILDAEDNVLLNSEGYSVEYVDCLNNGEFNIDIPVNDTAFNKGADAGEEIYIKIFVNGKEYVIEDDDNESFIVESSGGYTSLIDYHVIDGYKISLKPGWNLVSFPFEPNDSKVSEVFNNQDSVVSIWNYDSGIWAKYILSLPFLSDLEIIEAGKAYWIEMEESTSIVSSGSLGINQISLSTGWNFVGYNLLEERSVEALFGSIMDDVSSIWSFSEGKWSWYDTSVPLVTLNNLNPGKGYWIKMKKPAVLNFE